MSEKFSSGMKTPKQKKNHGPLKLIYMYLVFHILLLDLKDSFLLYGCIILTNLVHVYL